MLVASNSMLRKYSLGFGLQLCCCMALRSLEEERALVRLAARKSFAGCERWGVQLYRQGIGEKRGQQEK